MRPKNERDSLVFHVGTLSLKLLKIEELLSHLDTPYLLLAEETKFATLTLSLDTKKQELRNSLPGIPITTDGFFHFHMFS